MVLNSPYFTVKSWLVQSKRALGKRLLQIRQTATGKESSNLFMAGSLPKTIHFYDSLQSDEDSFELIELIESYVPFSYMVLDLRIQRPLNKGDFASLEKKQSRLISVSHIVDLDLFKLAKTAKKQKFDDKNPDKDDSEDSDEASKKDDSTLGTTIPINPAPVAMKTPCIANYKIIKQGRKGVYRIVRENGTDKVYISFGAMLTDISRDDLTELYRIVMRKHGMNEPEDELEKVLWGYLKNMFEEPLSTYLVWSLPGQQRLICWRYYEACKVHCLNLESVDIYMLIERKYHLSAEVCKEMLDKKLQGGKPDEDCYKMLKMMEQQAGIKK
ncbi:hypothetical protein Tco_0642105 [Tanacetum coccineum]